MKSDSLKSRILSYVERSTIHDPEAWVSGLDIERQALLAGWKASNASRRLRELSGEGLIDRRERNGCVEYRSAVMYNRMKNVGLV